jgi:hypothetical protein
MLLNDYLELLSNETFNAGDRDGFDKNEENYSLLSKDPLPNDWSKKIRGCPNNVPDWDCDKFCEETPAGGNREKGLEICSHCWRYAIQIPGTGKIIKNEKGIRIEIFPHPITGEEILQEISDTMQKVFGNLMRKNK